MEKEYIVIDKTAIQKRIELLDKEIDGKKINVELERLLKHELKQILSQSTPLIPEIEKAIDISNNYTEKSFDDFKQDYITNLKLDI